MFFGKRSAEPAAAPAKEKSAPKKAQVASKPETAIGTLALRQLAPATKGQGKTDGPGTLVVNLGGPKEPYVHVSATLLQKAGNPAAGKKVKVTFTVTGQKRTATAIVLA